MNKPQLYDSSNAITEREVTRVLPKYINSMSWKTGDQVLDVGCGPGDVTTEVLLPRLPADFGLLVGADISAEMIKYASKMYTHSKLRFTEFDLLKDIGSTSQLQPSRFDKIFCFFLLHWIADHRTALRNLHILLRTGGETLIVFFGKNTLFEAYEIQSRKPEWQPYLKDFHQFVSPYQHSSDPGEEFRKLLHDTGFKIIDCECRDSEFIFDTPAIFRDIMTSVNPFLDRIPRELQEQYMTEHLSDLMKLNMGETYKSTDEGGIPLKYELLVAFARKI